MRRREYVTFFGGSRRGDIFGSGSRGRGWILPVLVLVAAASVLVVWLVGGEEAPVGTLGDGSPIPSVLSPMTTTTTLAPITDTVACPDAITDWVTFHGAGNRSGCVAAPTISDPKVLWSIDIGVQGWLNNPVIAGSRVYVGSAGSAQFEPDAKDGVYAVDVVTGSQLWHFVTDLDVNGASYSDGIVVAVGDEGSIWAIDADTGDQQWVNNVGTSVFGSPLFVGDLVVVGDSTGTLTAYNASTGQRQWLVAVQGAIRGGASTDGQTIYAIGESRDAVAVDLNGIEVWRTTITPSSGNTGEFRVFSTPTLVGDLVVVSLVRDDIYPEPGLIALDRRTGEIVWEAVDTAGLKTEWGNVRSSPAVVGETLVYVDPYSEGPVALDLESGRTLWKVEAGAFCVPHWPSPAVNNGQVIVGRHDGGLYGIDARTGTLSWSIYLGDSASLGRFPEGYSDDFCDFTPASGFSILASPAVDDTGIVVVGTLEGLLIGVGDQSWE